MAFQRLHSAMHFPKEVAVVVNPAQPLQHSARRELEIWWQAHPARWPLVPRQHYIGPDGRVLPPADFAIYAQDASKLICIVGAGQPEHRPL